ncbi:hypothetical protein HYC85_011344 [Camellia sinensis]|uniref:Uncharacterized protein n=1 Tax=Camellia sinensis TaxID=4442 RepID=A0A7J7HAS1_CAMSI|nr:hypothetical protein HYC85_011344 [Camellia sinensis]
MYIFICRLVFLSSDDYRGNIGVRGSDCFLYSILIQRRLFFIPYSFALFI